MKSLPVEGFEREGKKEGGRRKAKNEKIKGRRGPRRYIYKAGSKPGENRGHERQGKQLFREGDRCYKEME